MFYQVTEDSNHNKQLTCLAGQVPGNGCPLGSIMPYYGTTMPSRNWLLCDGSTFDADEYPALYEFLGSNTLPDLRGEFLRGAGTNGHSGQGNGGIVGAHQDATAIPDTYWNAGSGASISVSGMTSQIINPDGDVTAGYLLTISGSAGSGSMTKKSVRPTNTSVNWIIKATSSIDTETSDNVYATIHEEDKYKTTEVNTGKTWIDGKPIYRKCYHFNGNNTSNWTLIDSTFTYEKYKIVSAYGCIDRVGEGYTPVPYNDGARSFSIACWAYNDPYPNLRYLFNNGVACEVDLIIEYTKK